MINPFRLFLLFLGSVLVCTTHAQQPPAPATASEPLAGKPPGRLRAWMFPGAQGAGQVAVSTVSADGNSISLATAGAQSTAPFYRALPPGNYSFVIKDGEKVLGQKQALISSASFYTLVAWLRGGKWDLELYPDSAPPGGAGQRSLRILNFAAGANTTVSVGSSQKIEAGPDSIQEVKLPAKITPLEVSAQPPGSGAPARTLTQVDLAVSPAVYILVAPDYRGRLRPQIIRAGELPAPAE